MNNSLTNKELFARVQKHGDRNAYSKLYDGLWENMYTLAFALTGNKNTSKDLVQDIFASLWERRKTIDCDDPRAYLLQAIRYGAYKEHRSSKYREELWSELASLKNEQSNTTDELIDFKATERSMLDAVKQLPEKCQTIFRMSRFDEKKNSEIAQELGLSQRTVETHISNALKFLRSKLLLNILLLNLCSKL